MCIWPPSVVFVRLLCYRPYTPMTYITCTCVCMCTIYSSLNPNAYIILYSCRTAHVFIPIDLFSSSSSHARLRISLPKCLSYFLPSASISSLLLLQSYGVKYIVTWCATCTAETAARPRETTAAAFSIIIII